MDVATYGAALRATFANITDSARLFLPNFLGAVGLLLGGWLLALLLQRLSARVTRRFDGLARRSHVDGVLQRIGVHRPLSEVVGAFVFWTVFLFFVAGANVAYGAALAHIVRTVLLSVAVLIAVNELGIEVTILTVTLGVVLGATFGGVALAFGLGARTAVSNIIGSHYIRQIIRVGQTVRLGVVQGEVEAITPTAIILRNGDGRVIVPAKEFSETVSMLPAVGA